MIEIKITTDAAVNLLIERINYEHKLRIRNNMLSMDSRLEDLKFKDLAALTETAAIDLVFLLPVEALIQKSNLPEILLKSFRSLSKIYKREEFEFYTLRKINTLLKPIREAFSVLNNEEDFKHN